MEATVYDAQGVSYTLPTLLRFEFSHGFCSPCDSFELTFLYDSTGLSALQRACRVAAYHEGTQVFAGVVDEFEAAAEAAGCLVTLRGRGLQALLLDSEAPAADYLSADTDFILSRHARALGVNDIQTGSANGSAALSVDTGESHWSVVQRFCEFCLGLRPRFTPAGTLLLDGMSGGRQLVIDDSVPVTAQTFAQERYGVISEITVRSRARYGGSVTVKNESFAALGGQCARVLSVPRTVGFDAMRHTGAYRIEKSGADFLRCRITLPQLFAAFPGDRVTLAHSPLGITGEFFVSASRSYADGDSAGTVLELRQDYQPTIR